MAKLQFNGIKLVLKQENQVFEKNILYFVRENNPEGNKNIGYIHFNGKEYGNVAEFLTNRVGTKTLNGKTLTDANGIIQSLTLNGADIKLDGYAKAASGATTAILATDTVNVALGKLERALEDVGGGAITEIVAGNGIAVSAKSNHERTVSVKIDSASANGLSAGTQGVALAKATTETFGATQLVGTSGSTDNDKAATPKLVDDTIKSLDAEIASADGKYVNVKVTEEDGKITAVNVTTEKIQDISDSTAAEQGLADAYDVKTYVEGKIGELDVEAVTLEPNETITSISEEDGKISVTKQNIAIAHTQVTDWAANIGVTALTPSDASVTVTDGNSQNPKVAVNIKDGEKVLSTDGGLKTTLTIDYDGTNKRIQLKGINGTVFSDIDASDFVKDGMLYDEKAFKATGTTHTVEFKDDKTHTFSSLTVGNQYLAFCFTDGAVEPTFTFDAVDLTETIKTYTAGDGITINDYVVSADVAAGNGLSVDADGIKMAYATTGTTGATKLNGTIAATDSADDTTAATPKAVRAAINDLNATVDSTGGTYIGVQGVETDGKLTSITVTETIGEVSTGTQGLAEASDVKDYVDGQIYGLNATVTGSSNNIQITVTETAGKLTAATATLTTGATADGESGLAIASDVKAYSDGKAINGKSGHTITLDSTDITVGDDITYTGETGDTQTIINSGATIAEGLQEISNVIAENERVTASALTELDERIDNLNTNQVAASGVTYNSNPVTGSTTNVLNDIYSKLAAQEGTAIQQIESTNIQVSKSGTTATINVKKETRTNDTVDDGHIEIAQNNNGELFAVMFYDDDDTVTE